MEEIEVEGFVVTIIRDDGKFVATVPKLPGCTVQADSKEDVVPLIRAAIGDVIRELAEERFERKKAADPKGRKEGELRTKK